MNVDTVTLSHMWASSHLSAGLSSLLSRAAFIICHKHESLEELSGVVWFLPADSPILVVSNCPDRQAFEEIKRELAEQLPNHTHIYLLHQKDRHIAQFFRERGVHQLLGADGLVANGKGEGMYIGTLGALLLGYPESVFFYDADNAAPSALVEYTLGCAHLFLSSQGTAPRQTGSVALKNEVAGATHHQALHNVRISWASKHDLRQGVLTPEKVLGRCTRVISPIFDVLLRDRFGVRDASIVVSNAGEQAMTIETARALRFSSGFSVETFQLLDLLSLATASHPNVLLQQYRAKSRHFHDKKDDQHIQHMIAESLGCFFLFETLLSENVRSHLWRTIEEMKLPPVTYPRVYPALSELGVRADPMFMECYRLSQVPEACAEAWEGGNTSRAS